MCSADERVYVDMQTALREVEEAAKCEALAQMEVLRKEVAEAAEEKSLADSALNQTRRHLDTAWAQVRTPHLQLYCCCPRLGA